MTSYPGADYGEHRRADAQTSCDSAGSSDTGHHRTEPLLITGNKTRDAALGEPRIRAGEIIGWRFWKLHCGFKNPGYHAFRDKEQAECQASTHAYWAPSVIGSVAMWGEVIEHQNGWRSEYAAVHSIINITGYISFRIKHLLLLELREKYR